MPYDQSYSIPEGRVRLTDTIIERLPFTEEGQPQYFVKDSIIRNLWIIVGRRTKSGALVTYTNGKQRYETLGQWPTLPIKEMRDIAMMKLGETKRQELFGDDLDVEMSTFTLREGWDLFRQSHRNAKKAESTLKDYECALRHIDHLMDVPMVQFRKLRDGIEEVHASMTDTPAMANMVAMVVTSIWNRVREKRFPKLLDFSPARGVTHYERMPKKQDVSEEAMRLNYQNILGIPQPMRRLIFMFMLYSPLRKMEVASLRWDDVESDHIKIRAPKGGVKRAFDFPLSHSCRRFSPRRPRSSATGTPGSSTASKARMAAS